MNINPIKLYKYQKVYKTIKNSGLFDSKYYLFTYPDVRAQDIDPIKHYILYGAKERRNPSTHFDTNYYLNTYKDIEVNKINPLFHYIVFGWKENRNPSSLFDTKFYLDTYKDVKNSGMNALLHFVKYGKQEGRNSKKSDLMQEKTLLSFYINEFRQRKSKEIKKRLLIFSHYNKQNLLSDYVIYTLKEMNHLFAKVVFVSNSIIDKEDAKKLEPYCDKVLIRKNIGFDFGGWKEAILDEGFESLSEYDSMTLMNDTCFGPLQDMTPIYQNMESREIDFWGLTNHRATSSGMPGTNGPVPEHLQSYFLVFNNKVLKSNIFNGFWSKHTIDNNRNLLIQNCETRLTPLLNKNGFKSEALIDCTNDTFNEDIAMNYPELLLERGMPFFKIRRFRSHENPKYLLGLIEKNFKYPIKAIKDFFLDTESPTFNLKLTNKVLFLDNNYIQQVNKSIVHIHVFYPDVLYKILLKLKDTNFDIVITYCSEAQYLQIQKMIDKTNGNFKIIDIIITENIGRDILPWLKIQNILKKYEFALHIHTKKSPTVDAWIGEKWLEDNLDNLVTFSNQIVSYFEENPNVGVILPEVPSYFKVRGSLWGGNEEICQNIWEKLKCKKKINFKNEPNPIFPVGFMFWYRVDSLKKLFNAVNFEFPLEPIPNNKTILHAIERLPVYVAWSEGYDYRVAITESSISSGFDYKVNSLKK